MGEFLESEVTRFGFAVDSSCCDGVGAHAVPNEEDDVFGDVFVEFCCERDC